MSKKDIPEPKQEAIETVANVEIESVSQQAGPQITELTVSAIKGEDRIKSVLSDDEIEAVKKEARKSIEKDKKDHARKRLLAEEIAKLRVAEGVGGVEDDMVNILIDTAIFANSITLDGKKYWHGATYTVPRHVARSLSDIMFRGKRHQAVDVKGEKLAEFYRSPRQTVINGRSGVIINAPTQV